MAVILILLLGEVIGSGSDQVISSVDMRSALTLPPMPQPPKGLQARNPLGTPALAHVSLAHFVGPLAHRFGWRTALFASLLMTPKTGVLPVFLAYSLHSAAQMCF